MARAGMQAGRCGKRKLGRHLRRPGGSPLLSDKQMRGQGRGGETRKRSQVCSAVVRVENSVLARLTGKGGGGGGRARAQAHSIETRRGSLATPWPFQGRRRAGCPQTPGTTAAAGARPWPHQPTGGCQWQRCPAQAGATAPLQNSSASPAAGCAGIPEGCRAALDAPTSGPAAIQCAGPGLTAAAALPASPGWSAGLRVRSGRGLQLQPAARSGCSVHAQAAWLQPSWRCSHRK
jgi:hypothetical protein